MSWLIWISVGISIVTTIMLYLQIKDVEMSLRKIGFVNSRDSNKFGKFVAWIKYSIICFIPILNIGLFIVVMFYFDNVMKPIIEKTKLDLEQNK